MTFPYFSIIIPTYNRSDILMPCIRAITRLDYPPDRFEIIIVDDGSQFPVSLPEAHLQEGIMITVLQQCNGGPASARNAGAQKARGDIFAFTDDDCVPDAHWLREFANAFHKTPSDLLGGRTINGLRENPYSTASQIIADEAYTYFFSRKSELRFFASNNMAIPARLFHECGGFDPSFRTAEDRDFCDRWMRDGHSLTYVPKAVVHHHHHLTFTTFCRQHFHYGRGAYRFHRGRAGRGPYSFKPDLRFYAAVFRRALFSPLSGLSLRMAALMGVWQLANVAGFLWQGVFREPAGVEGLSCHRPTHYNSSSKKY